MSEHLRSAEDVAWEWEGCDREEFADGAACRTHDLPWPCADQAVLNVADLIRARDAEVREAARAEALAGFVEQKRTMHDWRPCDCPGAPDDWREQNPHVDWSGSHEERRLVGPWEPTP